jgi:methyl-accepting chemotaxis protein
MSILIGMVIFIGISIASAIVLRTIYTNSYSQALKLAEETSKDYAKDIGGDFDIANNTIDGICNSLIFAKESGTITRKMIIEQLKVTLSKTPSVLAVFTLWEPNAFDGKDKEYINKEGHDATGRFIPYIARSGSNIVLAPLIDYDKESAGDYYLQPKQTKKITLLDPYTYKIDGKDVLMTSIVMPILDKFGNFLGIVGADIALTSLQEKVNNAKPMGGYSVLITNKGTIVAHGMDPTFITKNIVAINKTEKDTLKKIANGESFNLTAKSPSTGALTLRMYKPLVSESIDSNWSFVSSIPNNGIYAEYYKLLKVILIVMSILMLIVILTVFFLIRRSINPIKQLEKFMNKAGLGDLTVRVDIKTNDEIQKLGESFNEMIKNQSEIITHVRISSGELAAFSEVISASTEEMSASTEVVTTNMQEVSESLQNQNNMILETSEVLVQLSSLVQIAQNKANITKDNSFHAMDVAKTGRIKVEETVLAIDNINKASMETEVALNSLAELSSKIVGIISTINGVSEQTNLLALNAAIEAARAGEHGRGFSVVAEEVRKLSEASSVGAKEISLLVNNMVSEIKRAVETMSNGKEAVDNGVIIVNETDKAFIDIINSVEQIVNDIEQIVEVTKDEVENSEKIVTLIDSVATISETTTRNGHEVAVTAEEQLSMILNITESSQVTSSMAMDLNALVEKFIVEVKK